MQAALLTLQTHGWTSQYENQETIMQNQHQLEYKLHKIISLLTPAHPVPDTFTSSPIVPAQPQTGSVLSAPTPSASISDQQLNATNVRKLSYDQLFQLSKSTRSRLNFAALLLRELFQPTELQGKALQGLGEKIKLILKECNKLEMQWNNFTLLQPWTWLVDGGNFAGYAQILVSASLAT